MIDRPHYSQYQSFSDAFVAFSNSCRRSGLNIGIGESLDACQVVIHGLWGQPIQFKAALSALFCSSADDLPVFDYCYDDFWVKKNNVISSRTKFFNQAPQKTQSNATVVMMGFDDKNSQEAKDAKNTSGANAIESLKSVDFAKIEEVDATLLEQISERLFHEMSLRLKRKYKKGKKGRIDFGKTIRQNMSRGGNLIDLLKMEKKNERFRLVVLLDVSGSMDKYSFYLLRFIYALKSQFKQIEAFIYSTEIERISSQLDDKKMKSSLAMLTEKVRHWSSGTEMGKCLRTFNEKYAKRILNGKTLCLILSDGLDTGDPDELINQLKKIKMRSKKMVWLNPLKGMTGYEPVQKGMKAALPEVDVFQSAHNLNSLLKLEKILIDA